MMAAKKEYSLNAYETDASGITGKAAGVVFPKTIAEVCALVKEHPRLVSRGGGTGFCGGCVPLDGVDVVLDVSRLNKIESFDSSRMLAVVEAGVILGDLQQYLHGEGCEFAIDMLSEEVCTIGGMVATNAAGGRSAKYGRMTNWIRWIEIVDSSGAIQRKGVTELSDYVGMEGTTGIIVRVCLKIIKKVERSATLVTVANANEVEGLVTSLKRNRDVSMVELFDPLVSKSLGIAAAYHVLIEYENSEGSSKEEAYERLMTLRKNVYGTVARDGHTRIEDVKVPAHSLGKLLQWLEGYEVRSFGHAGYGIIHPCFRKGQEQHIPHLLKYVTRIGGTITGSFGIGLLKKEFVEHLDKQIYTNVQRRLDPQQKFNREKLV